MSNDLRTKIVEKAGELFQKYGTKSVSMDDICQSMRISKKTIYQEVEDKQTLIQNVIDKKHEEVIQFFDGLMQTEEHPIKCTLKMAKFVYSNLLKTSTTMAYDLNKYHPECFQSVKEFKNKFIHGKIVKNIEKGQKMDLFRMDINADIVSSFYLSLYDEMIAPSYPTHQTYSVEDTFMQMLNYHLNGICTPEGIQELKLLRNQKELWPQ